MKFCVCRAYLCDGLPWGVSIGSGEDLWEQNKGWWEGEEEAPLLVAGCDTMTAVCVLCRYDINVRYVCR